MAEGFKTVLLRNLSGAFAVGDLSQAALILDRLREEDPLSVETRGMQLEFLLRSGKLTEAQTLAEQLLQLFPASPRIQYLAGQVAYQVRDYGLAAERFRESYRIRNHWRSSLALAQALTQLGEFGEAALIFDALVPDHPHAYRHLAWLYERQGDYTRALAALDSYRKYYPENESVLGQQARLRARLMDPAELISETQELLELGDEPDESLLPQYLEALFRTGQAAQARTFIEQRREQLRGRAGVGAAWVCYQFQAYDLAYGLFVTAFAANQRNAKYLSALEFAAGRCGRLPELIQLYRQHAPLDKHLFGRLRRLERRK